MRLWCEMGFAQVLILEDRMNEIISRIAAAAGISEETALEAVTIILNFLKKDGPQEEVDKLEVAKMEDRFYPSMKGRPTKRERRTWDKWMR